MMKVANPEYCTEIFTDACTTGYGAVCGKEWFAGTWSISEETDAHRQERDSIPWKELHTVVRAADTWGKLWAGKRILLHCDCEPAVLAWRKGDSRNAAIASLIRTLMFITPTHDFTINRHYSHSWCEQCLC